MEKCPALAMEFILALRVPELLIFGQIKNTGNDNGVVKDKLIAVINGIHA